jgi:hypothetical protein
VNEFEEKSYLGMSIDHAHKNLVVVEVELAFIGVKIG